jgi:hypothetical protein
MELAKEVHIFSSACEHILSTIAQNRPLTHDEALLIEYYCGEVLSKIAPHLTKPNNPAKQS